MAHLVQLGGRLAEVPDVSARVLRVPILRSFREVAVEVEAIVHLGALDAVDLPRTTRHLEDVAAALAVFPAGVDVRRPRLERIPRIVDALDELRRLRRSRLALRGSRRAGGQGEHEDDRSFHGFLLLIRSARVSRPSAPGMPSARGRIPPESRVWRCAIETRTIGPTAGGCGDPLAGNTAT